MQITKALLKNIYPPIILAALILTWSFSIQSGICEEIRNNRALDEKVRLFLEQRKGTWHDWNVPYSDGQILHNLDQRLTVIVELFSRLHF